jgi:transcription-repair coupling factor (superfamily II helicase)
MDMPPVLSYPKISESFRTRFQTGGALSITGLPGGAKGWFFARLTLDDPRALIVVTREDVEAEGLLADYEAWTGQQSEKERVPGLLYPEFDGAGRLAALGQWKQTPRAVLFCSEGALKSTTLSPKQLKDMTLEMRPGSGYPRSTLLEHLAQSGYTRTDMVQMEGEMAVRGEVMDVWPPDVERPWRFLFDGDTLESIREFHPGTQRSEGYMSPQKLLPVKESEQSGTLKDHVPPKTIWFWDDVAAAPPDQPNTLYYSGLPAEDVLDLGFKSTTGLASGIARAAHEAKRGKQSGKKIFFFSHNGGESERLQELLLEHMGSHGTDEMEFLVGPLRNGFFADNVLVLSNAEIFNRARRRLRLPKFKGGEAIREIHDIRPGHYVAHEQYGIGRYKGLELIRAGGQEAEFLKLEYAKGDKLYVPLYDFKQVQKYSGSEGSSPRLSSLDTGTWERVKARVKESVQELAKDLVKVHAARAALPGYSFSSDTHLEQEFEASFLYEETPDQLRAIADVKRDMESHRPMDRVVLGDVGYGKTEVAMRAAMKAVADGKQVGVLVPTTILAEQHFRTFSERFADYPAKIGMLSRFQTAKEVEEVVAGMAAGSYDIVIGTHRLFQKDVHFKDLGLLIIDEEHRFGVKHKEQLKKIRANLDVLTLTATPIPRTLSFALSGLRELSIIETPPTGRLPINTLVGPLSDEKIKAAVKQELERNGQVFYVHNRVQSMNARLKFLQDLLPNVSIAVVHGQMSGPEIEKVMWEFVHRKHDILLATTIIESGIDIPTVNTLIVEEAEEFGLAQLYQLRGRVGRDRTKAYCYLFYSPSTPLSQDARARLEALREFTDLGSGYRLAVRDMEIRGTGNLLGQQQSGHVAAVGLDLYTQLLQEEISIQKGEPVAPIAKFPSLDLSIHAFLPADYIPSEELRILFYKKLVSAETLDVLATIGAELEDRFGPLPPEAQTLMEVSRLRIEARDLGISGVVQKPSSMDIQFLQNTPIQPQTLIVLAHERTAMRFKPGPPFTLQIDRLAYESAGPLHYLNDLFKALKS